MTSHVRSTLARKVLALAFGSSWLFFSTFPGGATINASLQMQLGNPSNASTDTNNHDHYLIQRPVEAIDYNDNQGQPNWASWDLTASDVGSSGRSDAWASDTNLPAGFYIVPINPFSGSGYDRGHMCPSADRTDNSTDNEMVFLMSNIIPQASLQNQGIWANFETYCRQTLLTGGKELLIICGPSLFTSNRLNNGHVAIPAYTWKIVVVLPPGTGPATNRISATNQVIALRIPNTDDVGGDPWQNYRTNVIAIENDTGFTFFTALAPNLAAVLHYKIDGQPIPPPAIIGISPGSGEAGSSVTISGTNLAFATNVTFNGQSASFTINSATNLTATAPPGATTGPIAVATLGGTATSANDFTVTASAVADLTITSTHSGSLTQGDAADVYTLLVANVGGAASSGIVTVTDLLPGGLTATAIAGTGWTNDLATLTATRSDSLGAGSTYPPIIVTVSVATNAAANVTNIAMVSGGTDANPANNTVADPTVIAASNNGTGVITLAGWDVSAQSNYGASPLAPTTNAANLTIVGLTRGAGVATSGTAASRAWGGNNFTNSSAAAAIATNRFATFALAPNDGYKVSVTAISRLDYRRSSTGAASGLLQYQVGSGGFENITNLSYASTSSSGASLGPIDLSGISALQGVGAGTNITFRIVNYGGTGSAGNWYIFDVANSTAADIEVQGTVSSLAALTPIQTWRLQWFGTTSNSGPAADTAVGTSDGMPNLLKYALGLNPLVPTSSPVTGDISTGYLRLTTPKNPQATDVDFRVEVADEVTAGSWTTNGTTLDIDTATQLQVHDDMPVTASPRRFIRLSVSLR